MTTKTPTLQIKDLKQRQANNPEEPWRWNPNWDSGQIASGLPGETASFLWRMAIFWNIFVIITGVVFASKNDLRQELPVTVCLVLFLIAGFFLVYRATRLTLTRRKYAKSSFHMNAVPAYLGERLEGAIVTSVDLPGNASLLLSLECVNAPKKMSRFAVWSKQQELVHAGGRTIPVCFDIPGDQPESRFLLEIGKDSLFHWILSARMKTAGIDYHAVFEIPVYGRRKRT